MTTIVVTLKKSILNRLQRKRSLHTMGKTPSKKVMKKKKTRPFPPRSLKTTVGVGVVRGVPC